jgi:putative SOS response-associated peptidase YedK
MHYTKTVFIRSTNQTAQFKALRVGQWVTGLNLNSKSGLYRGQFLGMDNDNMPIINLRVDNAKRTVDWKEQFRSNRSLRTFAKIKA